MNKTARYLVLIALFSFVTFQFVTEDKSYLVQLNAIPVCGEESVGITSVDTLLDEYNVLVEDLYPDHNTGELGCWVRFTDDDDLFEVFKNHPSVLSIEVDETRDDWFSVTQTTNNDKTWNLRVIDAKKGLSSLPKSAAQVVVAVVDQGVDINHPALKERIIAGRNIVNNNDNPKNKIPGEFHGTHVAGTIAMSLSDGAFGVAHPIAKIMPVRVLDETGRGTVANVANGIIWAADNGAQVVNMSLGGPMPSKAIESACDYAVRKGVVVIAAKGNSNTDRGSYPGDFANVISVTATTLDNGTEKRAFFSNYGNNSGCAAPGDGIYSTLPDGKYGFLRGTSMACPHAAGAAALVISKYKEIKVEQIRKILETKGDELKTDKPIGLRINIVSFLDEN